MMMVGLWDNRLGRRSTSGGSLMLTMEVSHHSGWAGARLRPAVGLLLDKIGVAVEVQAGAFQVTCCNLLRGPLQVSVPSPTLSEAVGAVVEALEPALEGTRRERKAASVLFAGSAVHDGDDHGYSGSRSSAHHSGGSGSGSRSGSGGGSGIGHGPVVVAAWGGEFLLPRWRMWWDVRARSREWPRVPVGGSELRRK